MTTRHMLLISSLFLLGYIRVFHAGSVSRKNLNYDGRQANANIYDENSDDIEIVPVPSWPDKNLNFGQVSSVSMDTNGNVYVFHRQERSWDSNSFRQNETFTEIDWGPISHPTVVVIDSKTGALIRQWGVNMFYLPHGLTVDFEDNVWITDVAMHQVFKFEPILKSDTVVTRPSLELGTKFVPGEGHTQFCKPSAVAVLPSKEFFVSDGYCNSRIIKFASDGTRLLEWGRSTLSAGPAPPHPYHFLIPHDLTLANDKNLLCVSDRENGRIQCFRSNNGSFVYQIQSKDIGSRIFSASYTPSYGGLFFIVNGPTTRHYDDEPHGSVVDSNSDSIKVIKKFQPSGTKFETPHDVFVSPNGTELYVVELNPKRVWKFTINYKTTKAPIHERQNKEDEKSSSAILMAIFITAVVLCFGAILLTAALIYSKARTRGRSSSVEDLMLDTTHLYS